MGRLGRRQVMHEARQAARRVTRSDACVAPASWRSWSGRLRAKRRMHPLLLVGLLLPHSPRSRWSCSAAARLTSRVRCNARCQRGKMALRSRCLSNCMPRTRGVRSSIASKTLKRIASSCRRATSSAWCQFAGCHNTHDRTKVTLSLEIVPLGERFGHVALIAFLLQELCLQTEIARAPCTL